MKAIVYTKYGSPDVLQLKEVKKPIPKGNEVRVKIYATTVNRTDCATISAIPFFARLVTGLLKAIVLYTFWGELFLLLWLLIKGVNVEQWKKRVLESTRVST